jgi:hypothetical protein
MGNRPHREHQIEENLNPMLNMIAGITRRQSFPYNNERVPFQRLNINSVDSET